MAPGLKIWAGKPKKEQNKIPRRFLARENLKSTYWRKPTCMSGSLDKIPILNYIDLKKEKRKVASISSLYCRLKIEKGKSETCHHICETQGSVRSTPAFSNLHTLSTPGFCECWILIVGVLLLILCQNSFERLHTVIDQKVFLHFFVITPECLSVSDVFNQNSFWKHLSLVRS